MKEAQKSQAIVNKKKELYHKSSQYKSAVTSDINRLKFDIERVGKNFLIIGGSLYLAYKLSKLFTGSSSEDTDNQSRAQLVRTRETSDIVAKIKEQISLFLLALAFRKLKEFVKENSQTRNEQEDSGHSE